MAVMLGLTFMSLSLKVRHFDDGGLLVAHHDFSSERVPDHWVDYFLKELAETGEELPSKHVQKHFVQSGVCKSKSANTPLYTRFLSLEQIRRADAFRMGSLCHFTDYTAALPHGFEPGLYRLSLF